MHETRYELGNSELVPQKAYESDVSIHYHVKNLTFDIAGFYNLIDNYIYISPTGDTIDSGEQIYAYVQSNAAFFGGEAGFHLHPEKVKWMHLEGTFATVTGKQNNGDHLPFIPANKLNFELKFEKEQLGKLEQSFIKINSLTAFDQSHPAPEEEMTPGYTLIDLGIGTTIPIGKQQLFIEISINNLFDKKYIDHLSTLKEVGFFDPGRNVAVSLALPFTVR